jgi:hypothetical protein
MPTIKTTSGIVSGVSDDGRIKYASTNRGPVIDGKWAIRGYYCNTVGGMDMAAPVDKGLWRDACALMHAVDAEKEAAAERGREAQEERWRRTDEAHDMVAQVRGGPLDPNTF